MVAKLHTYRYNDRWQYTDTTILVDIFNSTLGGYDQVDLQFNNLADLIIINEQYGLLYRVIEGYNGGALTKAIVLGWHVDSGITYLRIKNDEGVGGWTNGLPSDNTLINIYFHNSKDYLENQSFNSIDIGADVIEDTLFVTKEVETIKRFDLVLSSATVEVDATDEIKTFMDTFWTTDKVGGSGLELYFAIGLEIEGRFIGYVAPENIIYDEENGVYIIEAYDWIKFLQQSKWKNFIPSYLNPNLSEFLLDNCWTPQGKEIIIDVTSPEDWDTLDYRAFYHNLGDNSQWFYRTLRDMPVMDFIIETFKHYNAVMYYDGNGNLHFQNRGKLSLITHNNEASIISQSAEDSYRLRDYDSLVINVKGEWRLSGGIYITYEGFALIWLEDGELQSLTADFDLGNLPDDHTYLDLRQEFNGRWFGYLIFSDRTREQRLVDYGELLEDKPISEITVDGFGYDLYQTFIKGGEQYRIIYVEEDETQGLSKLRLEQYAFTSGDITDG